MTDYLNKKYNLELEVLSPLHIGAGAEKDWMKGADYIENNGRVYILDHRKIAKQISSETLSSFLINKNDRGLRDKLSGNVSDFSSKIFNTPVSSDNDIKTFIKNGLTNKPIVPGSSLKGAIRSILLNYFIDNHSSIDKKDKRFEEKIFGSANNGDEFMRFIKIADAQFENTELTNTKIFNLFGTVPNLNGGWKHEFRGGTNNKFKPNGFNTIYEIIAPNEIGELSIALSDKAFDNFYENKNAPEKKSNILHEDISQRLFAIINEHTKKYINKQIDFFEKYANNETPQIINSLNAIFNSIPEDDYSCVLQMSAGSGFHSITGDWQFDDFSINGVNAPQRGPSRGQLNRKDSSKSRKIATDGNKFDLMGFVKLTVLSEELIAKRELARKEKLETERKAEQERLAKEQEEQEQIKAGIKAKEEAEKKAEQERLAKIKAEKEAFEKIKKEKEAQLLKSQEANKREKTSEIKKVIAEGLKGIESLDDFKKGKKIIETYFKALGSVYISDAEEVFMLNVFIKACITKSDKRWKKAGDKDWKLVEKWISKETAQQWYNELIK